VGKINETCIAVWLAREILPGVLIFPHLPSAEVYASAGKWIDRIPNIASLAVP
jgi:hypothetical protein